MQQTFNRLDELYLRERILFIDAIMKYQMRKHSAEEIEKMKRKKIPETKERKVHLSLLQNNPVL